jgi:hypothetical protein
VKQGQNAATLPRQSHIEVKNSLGLYPPFRCQNLRVRLRGPGKSCEGGTAAAVVQLNISNNTATQLFDLRAFRL